MKGLHHEKTFAVLLFFVVVGTVFANVQVLAFLTPKAATIEPIIQEKETVP